MRMSKPESRGPLALLRQLIAGAAVAVLAACTTPAPSPADSPADSPAGKPAASAAPARASLAEASLLYLRRCSVCHGERGDGRSLASTALAQMPRDFTTEGSRLELTREYMIAIVRDGRPGKPMVGRTAQLDQAQIEAIVDFVRAAFVPPAPATAASQGWNLYRPLCSSCHGIRGEGGSARRGMRRAPEVSLSRPGSTLTEARLLAAMSGDLHVSAMEGRRLSEAERQAVVTYVRQAFVEQLGMPPGAAASVREAVGH